MRRLLAGLVLAAPLGLVALEVDPVDSEVLRKIANGRSFYVRQNGGNDLNDGLSRETAWQSLSNLSGALRAGDTAYVGPGLYREAIVLRHGGESAQPITLLGDSTGEHTGEPAGPVMIAGSDPVDEGVFVPGPTEGVFRTSLGVEPIVGIVELDGSQERYTRVTDTVEHIREGMEPLAVVASRPSSFFYEHRSGLLYLHTSDGRPPVDHEIEFLRRAGIYLNGTPFVTVSGFVLRHTKGGAITFRGSPNGIASDNVIWGCDKGINVQRSDNVVVLGNTLFRNGNSGVYFLEGSRNGQAIQNVLYENVKGVRFGTESNGGLATRNVVFDNYQAGIASLGITALRVLGNTVVGNGDAQLQLVKSGYVAASNCFQSTSADQGAGKQAWENLSHPIVDRPRNKAATSPKIADCGPLPEKIDVVRLNADALAIVRKAGSIAEPEAGDPVD